MFAFNVWLGGKKIDTVRDAKQTRKEYRENGDYAPMRIVKRLERV